MERLLTKEQSEAIEELENHMKNDPLGFRKATGMNRQQFKQMQKETDKMQKAIQKMTPIQMKAIEMIVGNEKKVMEERLVNHTIAMNSCVNAAMHDLIENWTRDDADIFWTSVNSMVDDHIEKSQKAGVLTKKEWGIVQQEVKDFIFKALDEGKTAKEIKDEVTFKFSKLSKAQVKNAYAQYKEEWDKQDKESIEKAVDYIFSEKDAEKPKKKVKKVKETVNASVPTAKEVLKGSRKNIEVKNINVEVEGMSIVNQLQEKFNGLIDEKDALNLEIKKLEEQIAEKKKGFTVIDIKVDKIMQSIELLKGMDI